MANCPKCISSELLSKKAEGSDLVVQQCSRCHGIWLHPGQLEKLMPEAIKDLAVPKDATVGSRSCPDCQEPMHTFNYPQTYVQIDMCRECHGLWIDAGEAREIQVVRRSLKGEARKYDDIPGAKGRIISLVNAALDTVLHSY